MGGIAYLILFRPLPVSLQQTVLCAKPPIQARLISFTPVVERNMELELEQTPKLQVDGLVIWLVRETTLRLPFALWMLLQTKSKINLLSLIKS